MLAGMSPEELPDLLSRSHLEHDGYTARTIAAGVAAGRLHRVDHGWYVDGERWRAGYTEQRHLLRVIAAHRRRPDGGRTTDAQRAVFSHWSAAVLWQLPMARCEPRRVHVSGAGTSGHVTASEPTVARHQVAVAAEDVTAVDGIPCTGLARTVADTLRLATEEAGIALVDAALRRLAWDSDAHVYDQDAADRFVAEVSRRLPVGGRGVRRAREILALGDGRAQLPGESISRLYLVRLGFAVPRLQVEIPSPLGGRYFVDFGIDDAGVWGEFDGRGKYVDEALRGTDIDVEAVLLAEKEREDWIRGTTHRRLVRWNGADIRDTTCFRRRLAAFHVYPR